MKELKELKTWIYSLGPSWNLFGDVDKAKHSISKIEQRLESGQVDAVVIGKILTELRNYATELHKEEMHAIVGSFESDKLCFERQGINKAIKTIKKHCQ